MNVFWKLSVMIVTFGLAACARAPATTAANNAVVPPQSEAAHPTPTVQQAVDETLLPVMAYKSPTCGCCELWIEHMRAAGFRVEVTNTQDMGAMKAAAGVPVSKDSCHTAKVGDYYVEGHVPASDVKRLLAEKPDARGQITVGNVLRSASFRAGSSRLACNALQLTGRDVSTVAPRLETDSAVGRLPT